MISLANAFISIYIYVTDQANHGDEIEGLVGCLVEGNHTHIVSK
jgi:hypothetical protein